MDERHGTACEEAEADLQKNLSRPTLLGFSGGGSLALPLPLSGRATGVAAAPGLPEAQVCRRFVGIGLSARGT